MSFVVFETQKKGINKHRAQCRSATTFNPEMDSDGDLFIFLDDEDRVLDIDSVQFFEKASDAYACLAALAKKRKEVDLPALWEAHNAKVVAENQEDLAKDAERKARKEEKKAAKQTNPHALAASKKQAERDAAKKAKADKEAEAERIKVEASMHPCKGCKERFPSKTKVRTFFSAKFRQIIL